MNRFTTQVYQLSEDEAANTRFLNGISALAEECNAVWVSGSVHDEMAYADKLEEELTESIGDLAVEGIRQQFELDARSETPSSGE